MKYLFSVSAIAVSAVLAAGCTSAQYQEETTSRLTVAETAAARAQARADEAYTQAQEALATAKRAQQSADEANERALRLLEESRSQP